MFLRTKSCCNCKYLFQDWVRAGNMYCVHPCFLGDHPYSLIDGKGRCDIDRLISLPDKQTCDLFSPVLPLSEKENTKLLISIITLGTRKDLLEQTLTSIKKFNDVIGDIIITIDGTEDISMIDCLKGYHYFPVGERVGICESLNRSLSELILDYDYIMFCDDDIRVCSPISKYISLLEERLTVGIISGYHDCRMEISNGIFLPGYGLGLVKPITSGCHLVMRCEEIKRMMPFQGGHWIYPFIGFDEWVCRESVNSIAKIGKEIIALPRNIEHLGENKSTWEGKEQETEEYMNSLKDTIDTKNH